MQRIEYNLQTGVQSIIEMTPEEIAAIPAVPAEKLALLEQIQADEAQKESAKLDTVIRYLVTHTPEEIVTYVNTNVTDLASAKNVLGKLAVAVSVLAKKELR